VMVQSREPSLSWMLFGGSRETPAHTKLVAPSSLDLISWDMAARTCGGMLSSAALPCEKPPHDCAGSQLNSLPVRRFKTGQNLRDI
ncbi:unnamed protein product, partial [Rangifer tarandus platyrhynchus]